MHCRLHNSLLLLDTLLWIYNLPIHATCPVRFTLLHLRHAADIPHYVILTSPPVTAHPSSPGPLSLLCDAGNFVKIWYAVRQQEIHYKE